MTGTVGCWDHFLLAHDDPDLCHNYGVGDGFHSVPLFGEADAIVVHDSKDTLQQEGHRTQLLQPRVAMAVVLEVLRVDRDNRAVLTVPVDIPPSFHHWDEMPDHLDNNILDGMAVG